MRTAIALVFALVGCGSSPPAASAAPPQNRDSHRAGDLRVPGEHRYRPILPEAAPEGPYRVQIVDGDANALPEFNFQGRRYVMGNMGRRYRISLSNPTPRRVEAVVSVDGLDAIDGAPANPIAKRGYILPPYGTVTVDGFRTSLEEVASFRFSSVRDSYAARTGTARNVGVIGVAFFEEATAQAPLGTPEYKDDYSSSRGGAAPAPPAAPRSEDRKSASADEAAPSREVGPRHRPGLGTEYGEARWSRVSYTSFQRRSSAPTHVATVRYNDRQGLVALGVEVDPYPPREDLSLRETADPFPAMRFAPPPPR